MLIQNMLNYLELKGRASLRDIAIYFRIPESMVESMLQIWVKKDCISLIDASSCGTGNGCSDCSSDCNSRNKIYIFNSIVKNI